MPSRRQVIGGAIATGFFWANRAAALPRVSRPAPYAKWLLWYREPARRWVEALPVGTGRLGAMVFGGVQEETLQLNEDTFWAGGPYDPANPQSLAALPEIRELIRQERFAEAQELVDAHMMARPLSQMSYQTLNSLKLESLMDGPISDYRRWLDLGGAEAVTTWSAAGRNYGRSVIASAADQVLLVRCWVDRGSLRLALRPLAGDTVFENGRLTVRGRNAGQHGIEGALEYALGIEPHGKDIEAGHENGRLTLAGQEIAFVVAAETGYRDWRRTDDDAGTRLAARLAAVRGKSVAEMVRDHRRDHSALFDAFDIDLGDDPTPDVDTSERIRFSHEMGRNDPYLPALYLQYGRYLLAASSRPGTQPANLQGIWNESDTPPWGSKYTININTQMNYWPAEPLALAPCVEPLIAMVEELAQSGRRTARVQYGARGWVAHHNTDAWRATAPIDGAFWGMWPLGGAWLCRHLWDRYLYSGDPDVLERIYPVMRDAGLFFLDTLVALPDGGLVTSPSLSPENAHHPGVSLCAGPACDRQILRELFANIVAASELLGRDGELRAQFASARDRLPTDRIGRAGQLQEWLEDWDLEAPDIQHRHVSHLYALYPGDQIGPETPGLYEAARRSLAIRGDDATGWGIGWRINLWARLGDAERAYRVLRKLLGPDRTYPNMLDAHPPFQIDGNFGGAAGIIEMIVRDRPPELVLMPAFPIEAWPTGRVRGLRLRYGLGLDLGWTNGAVTHATFTTTRPVERLVRHGTHSVTIKLDPGEVYRLM